MAEAGGKSFTFHLEALQDPGTSSPLLDSFQLKSILAYGLSLMCDIDVPTESAHELVDLIKSTGMKSAVAISPATPSKAVTDKLGNSVDMILVMTVVPGAPHLPFASGFTRSDDCPCRYVSL